MKNLVIITGPTAVGKTATSIELAKRINGEIISADSIQVYKHLDIGSAKITTEEMDGVKHYLIDVLEPTEEFNVSLFQKLCKDAMDEIYEKGKTPIIVGGTGFYIQSVIYDIKFEDTTADIEYRNELEALAKANGNEYVHNMLNEVDEESAKNIHPNNLKRVIRALEYYKETGMKISDHNKEQRENVSPYNFAYFVLNDDRDVLYERINKRVDIMIENGLEEEIKSLMAMGLNEDMLSMQGIGYKEMLDAYNGNISLEQAIEAIKQNSRNFAKRQITWFKREKQVSWINIKDFDYSKDKIVDYMINQLNDKNIIKF